MNRAFCIALASVFLLLAAASKAQDKIEGRSPDRRFAAGSLLFSENFTGDLSHWFSELEQGGSVAVKGGALDIDVPAGCTVWFKTQMHGPLMIQYEATVIKAGGANDRVSDLNCFWMARDSRSPDDLFASTRSGKFADYDQLLTYYVGLGGNTNTTTRFRRYIGRKDDRPLLPENDRRGAADMILPNKTVIIRLIAAGGTIEYWRDDTRLFNYEDKEPYTSGWFGLRTTQNHMQVKHFRVWKLGIPASQP